VKLGDATHTHTHTHTHAQTHREFRFAFLNEKQFPTKKITVASVANICWVGWIPASTLSRRRKRKKKIWEWGKLLPGPAQSSSVVARTLSSQYLTCGVLICSSWFPWGATLDSSLPGCFPLGASLFCSVPLHLHNRCWQIGLDTVTQVCSSEIASAGESMSELCLSQNSMDTSKTSLAISGWPSSTGKERRTFYSPTVK